MRRRTFLAAGVAAVTAGCGRTLRSAEEFEGTPTPTGTPAYVPGESFEAGPLWVRAANGQPDSTVTFSVAIERLACTTRPTADGAGCQSAGDLVFEGALRAPGIDTGDDGAYSGVTVSLHFEAAGGTVVSAPSFAEAEGVVTDQGDYRVTVAAAGQRAVEGVRAHAGVRGIETGLSLDGDLLLEAETAPASGAFETADGRPT